MSRNIDSILLVDDDDILRDRLSRAFMKREIACHAFCTCKEALDFITSNKVSHAILDLSLPGESGLELIKPLKSKLIDIKILVLTGYGSIATAVDAMKMGAYNYISKPADVEQILNAFDTESANAQKAPKSFTPSLQLVEWEHIQRVLREHNGNISKTANALGMHRRSLQRKLASKISQN